MAKVAIDFTNRADFEKFALALAAAGCQSSFVKNGAVVPLVQNGRVVTRYPDTKSIRIDVASISGWNRQYNVGDSMMGANGVVVRTPAAVDTAPPAPVSATVAVGGTSAVVTKDTATVGGVALSYEDITALQAKMDELDG